VGYLELKNGEQKNHAAMKTVLVANLDYRPTELFQHLSESYLNLRMLILGVHLTAFTHKVLIILCLWFINDDLTTIF
jgi:hypothetical protein